MISQAVAEATKNSSAIFLDGIAVMALIGAGGFAAREYLRTRRIRRNGNGNGNNRNSKPGTAPECKEHREKLIRLDEKTGNMKEDIVEIKGDVKTLLARIPPRN